MPPIFWTQKQDIGPSARTGFAMCNDDGGDRVVLFGGDPGGSPLSDTWEWDGALWTQVADMGPSPRYGHALAYDPQQERVVLFGGAAGAAFFGDTWVWDGTEWTQVQDSGPQGRVGHAMVREPSSGRILLFGGLDGSGPLGDTWEWNGSEWTQVQDVGPSARRGHVMAFDGNSDRVVVFGGAGADGNGLDDTWAWVGTAWTQVQDTGPEPRVGAGLVGGGTPSTLLFGGVNSVDPALDPADRIVYGDTWRWDGSAWTRVQDIGPAPRWGHGMALRGPQGRAVLFGGSTVFAPPGDAALAPGVRRDTWEVPVGPTQDTGPEVAVSSVTVSPDSVSSEGDAIDVTVVLTGAAPTFLTLVAAIFFDPGDGNFAVLDPPGFTIPDPINVAAGETSTQFTIVRNADPLQAGNYAIGVAVPGGPMMGAVFTVA